MKSTFKLALFLCVAATAAQAQSTWRALPAEPPAPKQNPTTAAKVELGRLLFNDPRLSESRTVSCASCHDVGKGGADHVAHSIGVHGQADMRNTPTVLNAGFLGALFWDGRAASLEEQLKQHLVNPIDMGMQSLAYAVERIRQVPGYKAHFEAAFGAGDSLTADNLAYAISAYERSLVTGNTAYDRYAGGDATALDAAQLRGLGEFKRIDCVRCHTGATFNGSALVPGSLWAMTFPTNRHSPYVATFELTADQGRFEWTGKEADRYQWRVPTLRNLVYTAPYLHNGSVATLEETVRVMANTELNLVLSDAQVNDLVAFLKALSGPLPVEPKLNLPQ
jgi:cytochrome c peroxidase